MIALLAVGEHCQLRSWAERVLLGRSLADKLWSPDSWDDRDPGAPLPIPAQPGRPAGLEIASTEAVQSATVERLADPVVRGRVLHAFANHELLALELMALALLRFVDAPPAFRRGLATTLIEEQRHLRAYLARMQALGIELGERPLGGFFWRVMAPMPSPLDFVAHMALTFEQANLDFAREYASRMRAAGDEDTARVLDEVHADEIGHVKLGLIWFERWRDTGPSLFEAHRRALRAPITPRRARGIGLDRAGRAAAGLCADYVEQLASFESSRGRPPVVHWFQPTAELSLATPGPFTAPAGLRALAADLELLPAFAAARSDVMLVRREPSLPYRTALAQAGLVLPECVVWPDPDRPLPAEALPHPRLAALRPWGWSPSIRTALDAVIQRTAEPAPPASADRVLHAKTTWARLRETLGPEFDEPWLDEPHVRSQVATDLPELTATIEAIHARGYRFAVVKAPYGTAGRNAQRIEAGGLTPPQRGWLSRTLDTQGAVVVEPWLDRQCDVSLRVTVDAEGRARIDGLGRFLTDGRGQYLGGVLGPLTRAVSPAIARMLRDDGRHPDRLDRRYAQLASAVAEVVAAHGYRGPLSIDGLIYRTQDGSLRLRPLVEVNVRLNFGHVVQGIERHIVHGRAGLWVIVRQADLPAQGSMEDAVERARRVLPTVTIEEPPRLRQGVVPTTDPARVQSVGSLLLVAPRREEALRALEAAAPATARRIREALDPA